MPIKSINLATQIESLFKYYPYAEREKVRDKTYL